jgi:hypothetical protein
MATVEFKGNAPRAVDCHRIALRIRVQRMSFVTRTGQVGQGFGFIDYFQNRRATSAELGRYRGAVTCFEKFLESLVTEALDHGLKECSAIRDICQP